MGDEEGVLERDLKCQEVTRREGPGGPLTAIATVAEIVPGWVRCQVLRQEDTEQAGKILWEVPTSPSRYRHFSFCSSWE